MSTWDVLTGHVPTPASALVYDEEGRHAALSTVQYLAERGTTVTLATPDRSVGRDLGGVSMPTYLRALARAGVRLAVDRRLAAVHRLDEGMRAVLHHEYDPTLIEHVDVDVVVTELGTTPNDGLRLELRDSSVNHGQLDVRALSDGTAQPWIESIGDSAGYALVTVGDAAASRDVHAAILDARRVLQHL